MKFAAATGQLNYLNRKLAKNLIFGLFLFVLPIVLIPLQEAVLNEGSNLLSPFIISVAGSSIVVLPGVITSIISLVNSSNKYVNCIEITPGGVSVETLRLSFFKEGFFQYRSSSNHAVNSYLEFREVETKKEGKLLEFYDENGGHVFYRVLLKYFDPKVPELVAGSW